MDSALLGNPDTADYRDIDRTKVERMAKPFGTLIPWEANSQIHLAERSIFASNKRHILDADLCKPFHDLHIPCDYFHGFLLSRSYARPAAQVSQQM
jgi:hypothetical protein